MGDTSVDGIDAVVSIGAVVVVAVVEDDDFEHVAAGTVGST